MVFYESGPDGFINNKPSGPLSVGISGSFVNGSAFFYEVPSTSGAVIKTDNDTISGTWKGAGCNFTGSDLSRDKARYTVRLDVPSLGIKGSVVLQSVRNL